MQTLKQRYRNAISTFWRRLKSGRVKQERTPSNKKCFIKHVGTVDRQLGLDPTSCQCRAHNRKIIVDPPKVAKLSQFINACLDGGGPKLKICIYLFVRILRFHDQG